MLLKISCFALELECGLLLFPASDSRVSHQHLSFESVRNYLISVIRNVTPRLMSVWDQKLFSKNCKFSNSKECIIMKFFFLITCAHMLKRTDNWLNVMNTSILKDMFMCVIFFLSILRTFPTNFKFKKIKLC